MKRFERLADGQVRKRLSVAEMALALGVARRTLEHTFHDSIGLSPARYLTVLRLSAIRREFLHASDDSLFVADLVERYGIVHLGRFAVSYREMFGEMPSQTLRRTRR